MFCKNCGKKIPASDVRCPACGEPKGNLENGNGFWDMTNAPESPLYKEPALPEEPVKNRRITTTILSVLSVIVCLLCVLLTFSLRKNMIYTLSKTQSELQMEMSNMSASYGEQLVSIEMSIAEVKAEMELALEEQESEVGQYFAEQAPEDDAGILLLLQPIPGDIVVGSEDIAIFSVAALGVELIADWQRKDEVTGQWVSILVDELDFDSFYGVRVCNTKIGDISLESSLYAENITEAAAGNWRCQLQDKYGNIVWTKEVNMIVAEQQLEEQPEDVAVTATEEIVGEESLGVSNMGMNES